MPNEQAFWDEVFPLPAIPEDPDEEVVPMCVDVDQVMWWRSEAPFSLMCRGEPSISSQ
ncbi:MAG: hypothetical protein AB1411_15910 [Nitrospirota bacterium]